MLRMTFLRPEVVRPRLMLFSKLTDEGLRLTGFIDAPGLVVVTGKAADGSRHSVPIECNERGFFTRDIAVKGFRLVEVLGIPILKTRATLYVNRPVKNADEISAWFKSQGMETVDPGGMHITIAYSKRRVDWEALGDVNEEEMELEPSLRRSVIPLGDKGATVLRVDSSELTERWVHFIQKGAAWDYDGYRPHITVSYNKGLEAARFVPFPGRIVLGPEIFAEVNENWSPSGSR